MHVFIANIDPQFNQSFDAMENEKDNSGIIGGLRQGFWLISNLGLLPDLLPLFFFTTRLLGMTNGRS